MSVAHGRTSAALGLFGATRPGNVTENLVFRRRGLRTQDVVAVRQEDQNSCVGHGRSGGVPVNSQVVLFGRGGVRTRVQHNQP